MEQPTSTYHFPDPVLKKNITNGVYAGFVLQSWISIEGTEYVRVKWEDGYRTTCKADAVLPDTPENRAQLEARYDKHREKIDRKVAAIMAERQAAQ